MTTEKAGEKDKVIQMVPRTTEEELRAEIDELKRQLEASNQSRAGEGYALAHPKQPSRKALGAFGLLAVVVLVVAFVAGYLPRHRRDLQLVAEANAQSGDFPEVSVVTATRASANGELVLPGNIQAVTEAPILARADGFVKKRYVDIGDRVTQGQLLAEVEAPDLDQQVRQAEASVQQAQSDLERSSAALEQGKANEGLAKVTASRWDNLVRRGVVSRQENDQYQAQYQAQSANVKALDRAVESSKSNLSAAEANVGRLKDLHNYLSVRAPFAGVITLRNVDVGALVNPGNTLLFRIAQTNLLRTYVNVPQANASEVRVGQTAFLNASELPGRKFPATVTRTANSLDPASRTLLVEVQLPNSDGQLLPGMYVQVDLNLPRKSPPLLVSGDTLVVRPEGTLVAVVSPDNTVHFQRIAVGRDLGDDIEVLSGLTPGAKVIVNPNDSVQEGAKVRPIAEAGGAPKRAGKPKE